jgi:hypothetical protein
MKLSDNCCESLNSSKLSVHTKCTPYSAIIFGTEMCRRKGRQDILIRLLLALNSMDPENVLNRTDYCLTRRSCKRSDVLSATQSGPTVCLTAPKHLSGYVIISIEVIYGYKRLTCLLKAGITEPEDMAVSRERLCKHVSTATKSCDRSNRYTCNN